MFYLNNSETSWLVYADWLEDQDIDASFIRQEVVEPTTTDWMYEQIKMGVGCCAVGVGSSCYHYQVGTFDSHSRVGVAFNYTDKVGGNL